MWPHRCSKHTHKKTTKIRRFSYINRFLKWRHTNDTILNATRSPCPYASVVQTQCFIARRSKKNEVQNQRKRHLFSSLEKCHINMVIECIRKSSLIQIYSLCLRSDSYIPNQCQLIVFENDRLTFWVDLRHNFKRTSFFFFQRRNCSICKQPDE